VRDLTVAKYVVMEHLVQVMLNQLILRKVDYHDSHRSGYFFRTTESQMGN